MKQNFLVFSLIGLIILLGLNSVMAEDLEGYYNSSKYGELTGKQLKEFKQSPILNDKVNSGELPPVAERLPEDPVVLIPWMETGEYGGTLRWDEFTTDFDHFLRHINNADLLEEHTSAGIYYGGPLAVAHEPGILSSWNMSSDAKVYTFKIREGLKWSDGEPVTTEDVRFNIEDVLLNEEITPLAPQWLRWGDKQTKLEVIDEYTFKIIFADPYGVFIEGEIRENPWSDLIVPSHYLAKFHKEYSDWDTILPYMKDLGYDDKEAWGTFYTDVATAPVGGNLIKQPYPVEMPTLNPYVVTEVRNKGDWLFERNPYFYMVDTEGNQLPYIDKLHRKYISNKEMVNMDIIQGNTDLQGQFIQLADYPLFKNNEQKGGYKVLPLKAWQGQMLIYFFNLAIDNDIFPREIIQDLRFRQALSYSLDRKQIKESVFLGFGRPSQLGPSPTNPVHEDWMSDSYADYDVDKAKILLDEMNLKDTDGNGWREWNGEELVLPILYYEVTPPATPGSEMAKRYWEDIGIKVNIKQVNGNFLWERQGANQLLSSVWWLGGPSALGRSYDFLAPFPVTIPEWNRWFQNDGQKGIEPMEWAKEMYQARQNLMVATSKDEKTKFSKEIWELQAKYIPMIGTVADTPIPFVYNENLGNIEIAKDNNYTSTRVMEAAYQWYFKK